jgi:hypothetical protein
MGSCVHVVGGWVLEGRVFVCLFVCLFVCFHMEPLFFSLSTQILIPCATESHPSRSERRTFLCPQCKAASFCCP